VSLPVGDIVELIGPDRAAGFFFRQLFRQPAGIFHVIVRVRIGDGGNLDQLGALQAQKTFLLVRLGVGNDDQGAIAERMGDQGQADAGIARRAFDDGSAGFERAGTNSVADDGERRAVLDRTARIHEFRLAVDLAAGGF
jgi:hypothetical protein